MSKKNTKKASIVLRKEGSIALKLSKKTGWTRVTTPTFTVGMEKRKDAVSFFDGLADVASAATGLAKVSGFKVAAPRGKWLPVSGLKGVFLGHMTDQEGSWFTLALGRLGWIAFEDKDDREEIVDAIRAYVTQ